MVAFFLMYIMYYIGDMSIPIFFKSLSVIVGYFFSVLFSLLASEKRMNCSEVEDSYRSLTPFIEEGFSGMFITSIG